MSALTIWLPDDLAEPWFWAASGGASGLAGTQAEKSGLSGHQAASVSVVIAGQSVRVLPINLPEMRPAEKLKAAGFAVEEQLAAPLPEQHIVLSGDNRAAIISKARMDDIVASLSGAGIHPSAMYVDFDILPNSLGQVTLGSRVIKTGPDGHTMDIEWYTGDDLHDLGPADLAACTPPDNALNFMSGVYKPKRASAGLVKHWPRIAALFVGAVLAWTLLLSSENRAVQAQADSLRDQARSEYTKRTGEPAPANLRRAVTRASASGEAGGADFLRLSNILFGAMRSVDGVIVDHIQFDAGRGEMNVRIIYPTFESAVELEDAISANGGVFQAGGVREQNGKLLGDAILSAGGS